MQVIDAVLMGGPLDGATARIGTPHPDLLVFPDQDDVVAYVYSGFKDRGFDAELAIYWVARSESIAA